MNYLNNSYSLDYEVEHPSESSESEVELLKIKLLETHSKLIKELEYTKDLEEELQKAKRRQEVIVRENQDLQRRASSMSVKQDRVSAERIKQLEINIVDVQKKNDLLRSDLETMRIKTLDLAALNQKLQDQNLDYERSLAKLNDKLNSLVKEIKLRDIAIEEHKQEAERYRVKYEKQVANNQQAERELEDYKREKAELTKRSEDLEINLRMEKEKQAKQFNQILLLQKEAKDWKARAEDIQEEAAKLKDQVYQLKVRTKSEERNLTGQLERLTHDYNNLQALLKQRDMELESARRRPLEDASRRKNTYQETKQLVNKLEREEQRQIQNRSSPTRERLSPGRGAGGKPVRTYKEEKEQYLSMIESVGTRESQMLAYNLEKKKILAEIDKIDEARVKTKDMISRRRRLEVQLQNNEKKIDHIRSQLKKMKVM